MLGSTRPVQVNVFPYAWINSPCTGERVPLCLDQLALYKCTCLCAKRLKINSNKTPTRISNQRAQLFISIRIWKDKIGNWYYSLDDVSVFNNPIHYAT